MRDSSLSGADGREAASTCKVEELFAVDSRLWSLEILLARSRNVI